MALVLAKGRHWPLVDRVLLNDGHGRFPSATDLGVASDRSYSSRLADGDRDLDVVVSNDAPDPGVIYLNDGHGRFVPGGTYGKAEWQTRNVDIADINADGRPDIVVANRSEGEGGANYVCLDGGDGKFGADCIAFSREPATTVAADTNRDGAIDLVVPHRDGGQSKVYLNDGAGNFGRSIPFGPSDASIRMVAAADLDGDAHLDLVAIDERRGTSVYFGTAAGTFVSPPASPSPAQGQCPTRCCSVTSIAMARSMSSSVTSRRHRRCT